MSGQTSNIQQVISKTQLVERLYQTQKHQPDADQQKFATTIQQKILDKNEKTQETTKPENAKIKDREDKLSLSHRNKKRKKENDPNKDQSPKENIFETDVGQIIDIKV